ncbi:FtsX-like permease family protein, partial [Candidatus Heimdallarchaeota archaeon]
IDIVPFVDVSYLVIEYRIEGATELSGHVSDSLRTYLFPGTHTLTVILWIDLFESRTRTWTFTVADGFNSNNILVEAINDTISSDMILDISFFDISYNLSYPDSIFFTDGLYNVNYSYPLISGDTYQQTLAFDTIEPYLEVISPTLGFEGLSCSLNVESDAAEVLFKFSSETTIYHYTKPQTIIFVSGGEHSIIFILTDTYGNTRTINYNFIVNKVSTTQELSFYITIGEDLNPIENLSISISSIYNTSTIDLITDNNGRINFTMLKGSYHIIFEYSSENYDFTLNTGDGLNQEIWLNEASTIIEVRDDFANSTITGLYCIIRDKYGNRILSSYTDGNGRIYTSNLDAGAYSFFFIGSGDGYAVVSQEIYLSDNYILFNIPSKQRRIVFEFQYDNGTQIYNLPVTISTLNDGSIVTNTGLSSQVTLFLTYGFVDISITLKNGSVINLRRIFEPGMNKITIILQSDSGDQWSKIPFKSISGFAFLVSLSFEYVDYYLQGSLLFTYTLAYAEVLLILLVVIVNMNSIMQNLYSESKRESAIVKMIGGTNLHAMTAIFSRIGLVALIASIIGYGFGNLVLVILSNLNQTVFFGHTFVPRGNWLIFGLNIVLTIFIAIITTLIIARKSKGEKIVHSRRN